MGVRGLQGFVGSACPHTRTAVNFKELAELHRSQHPGCAPTVVVDAMCCLRYWYTPESWVCGGQWREYFAALRDFVKAFTTVGIKLVFFFDGMVEQGKRAVWVRRRLKNNQEIARIFHYIKSHREQPGRNMFFLPSGLAIFTRFALKTLGQETLCSLQEADYEVASYGLQHNCLGILGEDTDYLIYDTCPYFSISELCLDSLDTVMLCREKLCESLELSLADLPLLACLLGNDTVPEGLFESFRFQCLLSYTSARKNSDKRGNVILAVADHISKVLRLHQGEKKLEEMLPLGQNKALFYKGVASYLLPGQTSPWIFQKPKGITTLGKQIVSVSTDPEFKPESLVCTHPESKEETPVCTHPETEQEDPMNVEPEMKQQVTMVSDTEILKVARAQHVQAESYLVYGVMTSGEIECSNTLEDALDQALPSQAFVYRPMRQRVYSLLLGAGGGGASGGPVVREWFVHSGNPLRHPDLVRPLPMNVPGGHTLPGGPARFYRSGPVPPRKITWAAYGLTGCWPRWCVSRHSSACARKEPLQSTDMMLEHVDPRAVQLGSLLVRGLSMLVLVNSACGFPWSSSDFMPWNVFDGKLFHEKYLQSERGYTAEVLVEQDRSRLTRFHDLKSIVCKACVREDRHIVSRQHWRPHHSGRWERQGSGSHRTNSGHSRSGRRQHWRDQGPGSRQREPDRWRRHSPSSGHPDEKGKQQPISLSP
ncbi:constitutive coactivator of peroxisome proliferator-activated receptor gamma isoform X4 [Pteropus medius]|uniref:constitutive coactivator of peroxisome proliferator-activated receptor gamma isoform X4 n=1 Tax=Pteropus vampyrus TaxID=132908 RepID=UPI00196B8F7C|nr:constitutive coactivator of peroxisome proliferator-activated receptor gamma isoform X4 [Pteropus giganteus]